MKLSVEKVCLLIYYRKNENDFVLGIIFVYKFELSISLLRLTHTFILNIHISLLFFTHKSFSPIFAEAARMQNRLKYDDK
jgi:hypothetical protein